MMIQSRSTKQPAAMPMIVAIANPGFLLAPGSILLMEVPAKDVTLGASATYLLL